MADVSSRAAGDRNPLWVVVGIHFDLSKRSSAVIGAPTKGPRTGRFRGAPVNRAWQGRHVLDDFLNRASLRRPRHARPCRHASHEVSLPSADEGSDALPDAATHRTIPLRRWRRSFPASVAKRYRRQRA